MATLHVRNFPDELYARLREQASTNGRSIGAEAVILLGAQLASGMATAAGARRLHRMERRRRGTAQTPFEHFSPRARQVVVDAQDEARGLGHPALGTEHLLLAAFRDERTVAARALELVGLEYDRVRERVEEVHGGGGEPPGDPVPFSPAAKKALELALRESLDMSDPFIGPEHLLLGIARERESLGAAILLEHDQDADTLRRNIRSFAVRGEGRFEIQTPVRVLDLSGSAEEWEQQLNDVARRGYQLVQVVDDRAIFRRR